MVSIEKNFETAIRKINKNKYIFNLSVKIFKIKKTLKALNLHRSHKKILVFT